MDVASEETDWNDLFLSNINPSEGENTDSECKKAESEGKSGRGSPKKKRRKRSKGMKIPRIPPNYFLGFRVYNPAIHHKVKNFQQELIKNKPDLYPTLIKVATLHITLAVTHLANDNEIETVKKSLQEWGDKNIETLIKKPINLNFKGISTFKGRVAYIDLEQCENYERVCDLACEMKNMLKTAGFPDNSKEDKFTPHLTILKVRRNESRGFTKKNYKNDFEDLKKCEEHFGTQLVSHVQLLSMSDSKDETGYYKCLCQIDACDSQIHGDHSDCCKPIPAPSWRKSPSK